MLREALGQFGDSLRGDDGRHEVQGFLRPIDTDRIAADLKLEEQGQSRGKNELPGSDSTVLDALEQQITQKLEGEWTWHGSELVNNLRAFATRLIAVSIPTEFAAIEVVAKNALTRLREADHRAEAELGPLRETYIATRNELTEFQQRNHLRRIARDPGRRWTTVGLLIFLIAIESMFNGVFFAKGSQFGLVGGVVTAIGISAVNVVAAFALGLFPMRWINHRNWAAKALGVLFSIAGLAALAALHGFSAHYREATALVGDEYSFAKALETLRTTPFNLTDLNSYYLFGLGIIWAFAATWKGYGFDDPYPRYGAHHRRASNARNEYSDEHAGLFDDLGDIKEDTVDSIKAGIQRIPLFPQQAAQIRTQRNAMLQQFKGYEKAVESAVNLLLARYRDANRAARHSYAPPHFNTTWHLPHSILLGETVQTILAEPTVGSPMSAEVALAELRDMLQEVLAAYDDLIGRYPHPTQMQ